MKTEERSSNSSSSQNPRIDDAVVTNNRKHEEPAAISVKEKIVPPKDGSLAENDSHRWELFALREKIKEMEQRQVKVESGRLVHPDELKHLIPEFSDGLGINRWIDTIRYNSELYEWQDRTTLLYAGSRLTGAANEWYNGFRHTIKTFDEFAVEIKKAFPDRCNDAVIHSQLAAAYKKSAESYTSYVYRVNALGKSGNVSDDAIITYAIRGLSRDPLYDSLVTKDYSNIYDLIDNIKRCETHLLMRKNIERRIPSAHYSNVPRLVAPRQAPTETPRCYNCSDFGHHSSQCTKPRRALGSCFRCGSTSHVIRNCPDVVRRQPTAAAVQSNENETPNVDDANNGNVLQLDAYQEC
ncbi:uncharacterized protein LOC120896677 [Anopheles arabiensis]|nr:uncharacterized protein LOC120896677 [Anopheles arabiensis]